jgi:Tol biopolymer transport system component
MNDGVTGRHPPVMLAYPSFGFGRYARRALSEGLGNEEMLMDLHRRITLTDCVAALACAIFGLAAFSTTGCTALCGMGSAPPVSTATARATKARPTHRPASAFPNELGEEVAGVPSQTVNVFGEVNGASPRSSVLNSELAFQQHSFADEGYDSDVAVDPTSKWLLFASTRNSEHPSIYLQRVDGTAVTQLTDGGSDDAYPVFSPDAKQVAFSSTRAGSWQIYMMDADGRNTVQLTTGVMQSIHPSFSPDGTRLVYCSMGGRSGQWELWTLDLKTSEKRMIGYGVFPVWSPDKNVNRIAFQRARQRGSRWFSLWTLDLIEGEGRRATEVAVSTNAAILSPSWSPDGKHLAFATVVQPGKGADPKQRAQTDIWTIDADGANRQRLTDGRGSNLMPFWAPDHRVYFVSDRGGTESIWSVRAESSKSQPVEAQAPKKDSTAVGTADTSEVAPK